MSLECDHTSVGVLVWHGESLLLIERKNFPFGFAPPAGHVDDHGSYEEAARIELEEEVGLHATSISLVIEGRKQNPCRRVGGNWHYWKVFEATVDGQLAPSSRETKQAGWYSPIAISALAERTEMFLARRISVEEWQHSPGLEPIWYDWFLLLGIIRKQSESITDELPQICSKF